MLLFDTNSRIRKTTEGICFYEQDVLSSVYDFSGAQKVEVRLDYASPGFGIVLMEKDEREQARDTKNAYLIKLGYNDLRVFQRHLNQQDALTAMSCQLAPGSTSSNITLQFAVSAKGAVKVSRRNGKDWLELGRVTLPKLYKNYHIGIYSNAGNTIKDLYFISGIPYSWHVSTKNTMGGRIAFARDSFRIENCFYEAEVEQKGIALEAGKYYVKYKTQELNGLYDIKCYVLDVSRYAGKEKNLEDDYKNILKEDGSFILKEPKDVILKFKGHSGIVSEISLSDSAYSSFIETEDEPFTKEGSELRIDLTNLKKIAWTARVTAVPPWEDLSHECPYGFIVTEKLRMTKEMAGIDKILHDYFFVYDVDSSQLVIRDESAQGNILSDTHIPLTAKDENSIVIMKNIASVITSLILTETSGNEVNILARKTYKQYVTPTINGPIIVSAVGSTEPFDLSASYREVVVPSTKLELFQPAQIFSIAEDIPVNAGDIRIYGIPEGTAVNKDGRTIDEFAASHFLIDEGSYVRHGRTVELNSLLLNRYKYFVAEYASLSDYDYEFTNYERETFDGDSDTLHLEKEPAQRDEDIILCGIRKGTTVHEDYLYRVPSAAMITSIDYYADDYEIIPRDQFTVDYETNEIYLGSALAGIYDSFVVDYLKKDSYAINYRREHSQYEVDIATEQEKVEMHCDMHDDGAIYNYRQTAIKPDHDKYIIIKTGEGEDS